MTVRHALALTISLPFLGLSACTEAPGAYPSLAHRPIESRPDSEPETPAVAPPPDAALDARIARLSADVDASHQAFVAVAGKAEAAARRPGAQLVGSDAWVGATAALAELDTHKSDTQSAASELEQAMTDRGAAGLPPYPALDAAYARAQQLADADTARVAAIKASMGTK